jgi:hypothetical protein
MTASRACGGIIARTVGLADNFEAIETVFLVAFELYSGRESVWL